MLVLQASYIRPEYFTNDFTLFPTWPRFDAERSLALFAVTMAVLLAPKLFGLIVAMFDGPTRRGAGGAIRLVLSTLFEVIMSALLAPIMMMIQAGHVLHILFGFDTGWEPQRRDDGIDPVPGHRAPPSRPCDPGRRLAGRGLADLALARRLDVAHHRRPHPRDRAVLVERAEIRRPRAAPRRPAGDAGRADVRRRSRRAPTRLSETLAAEGHDHADGLRVLHDDPEFCVLHQAFLPPAPHRARGDITPERAMAVAKLSDARTIDDAVKWLQRKERVALLQDRALIALLARLPASGQGAE